MDRFEFDLLFGNAHQVANSCFSVFSPIGLNVGHFETEEFTIESVEERHKEVLFTFEPNVVVSEVETPSPSSSLSKHEEIGSIRDKAKSDQSSNENQSLSSGKTKVLVMSTDLFWTTKLITGSDCCSNAGEDGFVCGMEGVYVCSLSGSLDGFSLIGGRADFLFELLKVGIVAFIELDKSFLSYCLFSRESKARDTPA